MSVNYRALGVKVVDASPPDTPEVRAAIRKMLEGKTEAEIASLLGCDVKDLPLRAGPFPAGQWLLAKSIDICQEKGIPLHLLRVFSFDALSNVLAHYRYQNTAQPLLFPSTA